MDNSENKPRRVNRRRRKAKAWLDCEHLLNFLKLLEERRSLTLTEASRAEPDHHVDPHSGTKEEAPWGPTQALPRRL